MKQTWTFIPKKNNMIAELPFFGKEYTVMFEMFINNIPSHESILQIGLGGDRHVYGDRNPGIFTYQNQFLVSSALNGNKNLWKKYPVELKKWISVEVSQTLRDGKVRVTGHDKD